MHSELLLPGAIACADGGRAIRSSVENSAGCQALVCDAIRGRKPVKQFTPLSKLAKSVLGTRGRMKRHCRSPDRHGADRAPRFKSGHNQCAKYVWGVVKTCDQMRGVHRAGAGKHASEHAGSSIFPAQEPVLENWARLAPFSSQLVRTITPQICWGRGRGRVYSSVHMLRAEARGQIN